MARGWILAVGGSLTASKRIRAGLPLSVKLIVATSFVVAASVAISAYFGERTIEDLAGREVHDRGKDGREAIERESDLLAEKVAAAATHALALNEGNDVQTTLDTELRGAQTSGQHRIEWMLVTDTTGQVIAKTSAAPIDKLTELDGKLGTAAKVTHAELGPSEYVYAAPIIELPGQPPIGRVRMGISTAALDQSLTKRLADADADARASTRRICWSPRCSCSSGSWSRRCRACRSRGRCAR